MKKPKKQRWTERTRILTLMLAVMLPATALIAVSVIHLRSIQRDRTVEAAIQRDYQQVLAIADKRIVDRAYEMAEDARKDFPDVDNAQDLDQFLASHSDITHAFIYDQDKGIEFQSQPEQMHSPQFQAESNKLGNMFGKWFEMEGKDFVAKLKKMELKDGRKVYLTDNWVQHGDKWEYQSLVLFQPRGAEGRVALAGILYDTAFLTNTFFPQALNAVMPCPTESDPNHPQTAIIIRTAKDQSLMAASTGWDGGTPELERPFESGFPGLVLGIKLRGTTIADMSHRFLRTNFIILGALSLLLGGGILLTYRNVTREVALAKLKSDFVSNVSHELRTPLSLIRLYAETLELGRLPNAEKQHEYYQIIRKESERLTALINNILDFSRIEAGRKEYEFRETDLADLVRSTLESYRFQIEQNGFQLEQKIDDNLPQLQVDREAIARSLVNLVNNAVKYSSEDKFLSVSLYRSNGSVKLEVSDHGIGIPPCEQHKIFDKFYRVGDPLVHNTKGSGLGLSLVRHIVHAHGGYIFVDSVPGRGSKFIISLPVQPSMQREAKGATA
ncbi:MAG TPA: HAMP domain-containing sensor histidine kinase [Clostridia bacterium]|nr:HAMP domain-containing sensor histidine kinase [Clostridia bacterium]